MAGIGGTGVVTVAQILATAAMLDGWEVHGLDQTGLSQKAGPVISDVVLVRPGAISSNLVGARQADVILGFDALVAAEQRRDQRRRPGADDDDRLDPPRPRRADGRPSRARYPTDAVEARLAAAARAEGNRFVDATALAAALVGSAAAANIFLLGVAVQDGRIPVSVGAVERAIDLNGVSVDTNLTAFDWGRRWAHDPEAVERLATAADTGGSVAAMTVPDLPPALAVRVDELAGRGDLADSVAMLAADLVDFQDEAYAHTFLDAVGEAASTEQRVAAGSTRLTEAVARGLHKLMAYKDEYEVARLMLLPEAQATADAVGGAGATFEWHLHPPMLRALGMKSKLTLGRRARTGDPGAASWQAAARHPARSVRTNGDASPRTSTAGGVPRRHGRGARASDRRPPRRGGGDRRAARSGARLRGAQAAADR